MNRKFKIHVEQLHSAFEKLRKGTPCTTRQDMPAKGVYLFSEGRKHLYVGRSNNIPRRYATHRSMQGALVFILAAEASKRKKPTYRKGEGRRDLFRDPQFKPYLRDAQLRIKNMSFRAVAQEDPTRQALLEVYCAVALNTRYNDFDTH
jgi:hypothetical protein